MISENKKEYINSFAKLIRDTFNISGPIEMSDITHIVKELGGSLDFTSDTMYNARTNRVGEKFTILVNSNMPESIQIIAISQEIGHILLHMKRLDEEYWMDNILEDSAYFNYGRGMEKLEVDEFAKALLTA